MNQNTETKTEFASARAFFLVQRVVIDLVRAGIDAMRLEYMGSAEYEFGAARDSLERLVAGVPTRLDAQVTVGGELVTIHLVGPADGVAEAATDMQVWLDRGCRAKELCYFAEAASGNAPSYTDVNLWWSFTNDCMWTLDPELADEAMARVVEWGAAQ